MRSFHHSRARILFEVFCAFGISASCVEAWIQTYASAFLPVAGIAALYGLVHAFDMFRRADVAKSAEADEPVEVAERVTDNQGDLLVYLAADEPELLLEAGPQVAEVAEKAQPEVAEPIPESEPEVVEPVKESEPEVVEPVQEESEPEVVEPLPEPVADLVQEVEPEAVEPVQEAEPIEPDHEEPEYSPVAPLFEAEPFVRKQRAAFGRRRAG